MTSATDRRVLEQTCSCYFLSFFCFQKRMCKYYYYNYDYIRCTGFFYTHTPPSSIVRSVCGYNNNNYYYYYTIQTSVTRAASWGLFPAKTSLLSNLTVENSCFCFVYFLRIVALYIIYIYIHNITIPKSSYDNMHAPVFVAYSFCYRVPVNSLIVII